MKHDKKNLEEKKIVLINSGLDLNSNFYENMINIIFNIFNAQIVIISSRTKHSESKFKKVKIYQVLEKKEKNTLFQKIYLNLINDLKIAYTLRKINADYFIIFLSQTLIFSMLLLKIRRKKIILHIGASYYEFFQNQKQKYLFLNVILENIGFRISDIIVVYSDLLFKKWKLEKHISKIIIAHEHVINIKTFKPEKSIQKRETIGFIGRFSKEKGVLNFVNYVNLSENNKQNNFFLIAGSGPLKEEILKNTKNIPKNRLKIMDWVNHENIPEILNDIKFLVIPSYTEGLPNILLEAMACGTIVISVPVGAVSDVIKDGHNGFIIENNSPKTIFNKINELKLNLNLETVSKNASNYVHEKYNLKKSTEIYKKVFDNY